MLTGGKNAQFFLMTTMGEKKTVSNVGSVTPRLILNPIIIGTDSILLIQINASPTEIWGNVAKLLKMKEKKKTVHRERKAKARQTPQVCGF